MSHLGATFDTTAPTPTLVDPRLPALPGTASTRAVWARVIARAETAALVLSGIIGWAGAFYLLWLLGGTFHWR